MIDPVALSIFSLEIRWYGICYALTFLLAYFFIVYYSEKSGFKKEVVEDVFFYSMLFSVLGGRIFYILFYNLSYYLSSPLKIFVVWEGGMSIHGGFFFGILTVYYFSKKYKFDFLKFSDICVMPIAFGLSLGRLANFVNQELVGKITSSSLGIVFPLHDDSKRVPYQILVGFKNLLTFQVLYYLYVFKKLKSGVLTSLFLILYSFGRFLFDFYREPTVLLGVISMGQLLSLVFGIFGVVLLVYIIYYKTE